LSRWERTEDTLVSKTSEQDKQTESCQPTRRAFFSKPRCPQFISGFAKPTGPSGSFCDVRGDPPRFPRE